MNTEQLSRRRVLAGLGLLPIIAACGAQGIRLPKGSNANMTDGKTLSLEVYNELKSSSLTALFRLEVSSEGDEVTVAGFVSSKNDIYNIEQVAGRVPGVRHVITEVYVR